MDKYQRLSTASANQTETKTSKEKQTLSPIRKHRTPIQAIRAKCMDCSCGQRKEVRLCTIPDCALWPYRMGKRPQPGQTDSK